LSACELVVDVGNGVNEQALLGRAGNDRRARRAALERASRQIESQPTLQLLRGCAVTFIAVLDKNRTDV
jgi:hypothetical protein